jgi:DNA repair protein RadA/Sms
MSKIKTVFRCGSCGAGFAKWAGRCGTCGEWNTLAEELDGPAVRQVSVAPSEAAVELRHLDPTEWHAKPSGIDELDRVLGGGFVPGSVTLVGGEPGIGKSTLLLQMLASLATKGARCLLISGEESRQQIRLRAERLGALPTGLWLASETLLPAVLGHLDEVKPDVLVIDSIQTMSDPAMASAPGSVGQVRECANALTREAKSRGITTVLVGHVTKEGSLAGPRVLEHVVDTVLSFEGDRHHALRLLRATKHRFGATGELGLFEMAERGLIGVADPGALFLGDRRHGASGSIVACSMEGQRPLLVEAQALVTPSPQMLPRRTGQGIDQNRLALLIAVLRERADIDLSNCEVFASSIGGVRLTEPAADLPLALALASAYGEVPIPSDVVAIGEIGLAGEVRSVAYGARRLSEAVRLGFTTAVVPMSFSEKVAGMELIKVATVQEAVDRFDLRSSKGASKKKAAADRNQQRSGSPWFNKSESRGRNNGGDSGSGRGGGYGDSSPGDNYDISRDRAELFDPFDD